MDCLICESRDLSVLYKGKIRVGKFGSYSKEDRTVYKCNECKTGFLDSALSDYESGEYRKLVDGDDSPESYYKLHDQELLEKINIFELSGMRGKTVADIGCGAGSFLDLVSGLAGKTIAVEPTKSYHQELRNKGHVVYNYTDDALPECKGQVDFAVSFAVLEHVDDPLALLNSMNRLIKENGTLVISTPNYDNWLLDFIPSEYGMFFYRFVHKWYFDRVSLINIAKRAGFKDIKIIPVNKYDLSNALFWIRDKRPTGLGKTGLFAEIDAIYKKEIEKQFKSDFLYAVLKK